MPRTVAFTHGVTNLTLLYINRCGMICFAYIDLVQMTEHEIIIKASAYICLIHI